MTEETTVITKQGVTSGPTGQDSSAFGISVRAWLALGLAGTVCASHLAVTLAVLHYAITAKDFAQVGALTTITEPLYTLAVGAVSYYFGSLARKATS